MAGSGPAIALAGLTKFYGRQLGVVDITFDVEPGEVFGFLGPNGAGKTTTIRMLMGLLRITRGRATVLGQDVATAPPSLLARIGYLPGALALYRNLTGREYLRYTARMRRLDLDARIDGLAERLNLDLGRHLHDLSRGNQQKVGVIQAFMHDPDVLILDEPTSGLDPLVQREFEGMLREACERGAAVLLSSHILAEVEQQADRVAIVDGGRLLVVERIGTLKLRALRTIDLHFPADVPIERFRALPSVAAVEGSGRHLTCSVVGGENELLRVAVDLGVETVRTQEPSLEDVFMSLVTGGDRGGTPPAPEDLA
jgi:ABC-2 type transport system ATP-binding protein